MPSQKENYYECHSQCKEMRGKKRRKEKIREKSLTGSGVPRGGPHSIIATSPSATRVFCGSNRKSSRSTVRKNDKK